MKSTVYKPASFSDSLAKVVEQVRYARATKGAKPFISTGFTEVDKKIGGFREGSLIVLAGRPSMGKTALATGMAFRVAQQCIATNAQEGAGVLYFSLEASAEQLTSRLIASLISVPSHKMHHGDVDDADISKLESAYQNLTALPFYIEDIAALSVDEMCDRVRAMKEAYPVLRLVVIDSLQRVRSTKIDAAAVLEEDHVTETLHRLKSLAVELKLSILVLSHLSRDVEQHADKRPRLADVRKECPLIERYADVIALLYRDAYYLQMTQPERKAEETQEEFLLRYNPWLEKLENAYGDAECVIARNAYGSIGTLKLDFDDKLMRFSSKD